MCHLSTIEGHTTYYNAILLQVKKNIIIIFAIKQARKIFHSIYRLTKVKYKLHNLRHNFILFAFQKNIAIYNWSAAYIVFSGYA